MWTLKTQMHTSSYVKKPADASTFTASWSKLPLAENLVCRLTV